MVEMEKDSGFGGMKKNSKVQTLISFNYSWVIKWRDRCHIIFQERKLICPSCTVPPPGLSVWNFSLGERVYNSSVM